MKRLCVVTFSVLLTFLWLVPAALAADPTPIGNGRVLVSTSGGLTMAPGDQADLVFVTQGKATIAGDVNTLVVINGSAELTGAHVHSILAVRSPVTLGAGTVVSGDIWTLDSAVTQTGGAQVQGSVRNIGLDLVAIGLILIPALFLLWIGFVLATIVAGLLLAALAARQVRAAESLISHEPWQTLLWGIAGVLVAIVLVIALFITVVGTPMSLGILFGLWPLTAFVGYLVAAIWIGDWILHRTSPGTVRERPYLAAVIGILIMQILAIIPFFSGIASLFGFGAVLLLAWRTFRQGASPQRAW